MNLFDGQKQLFLFLLLIAGAIMAGGCQSGPSQRPDVHSYSRPDEVVVRHLDLDVAVDFEGKTVSGVATLRLENKTGASKLYLDTRDLEIRKITLDNGPQTTFKLGEEEPFLGRELVVDFTPETKMVSIEYASSPQAAALQWLSPEQTAGKKHPFLFSQSQAILARTWVPCQDSPGIRMTYNARVKVPAELMAVMSASNPTAKSPNGIYNFEMRQPIPPYLLALAVGDLEFRALGPHTGVYAEPQVIAGAAFEFADTEKMLVAAEGLYGPYRWDRYDILVLPPSFPYGGMENPRLTFATPTILAGDRSLVALVAHELAHSWSGNLVTNATWNDFWLNEGFTSYFENRIMETVYGPRYAKMLATLDYQALLKALQELPEKDTPLYIDLSGRDPDDVPSAIAYDKGSLFLRMLETTVGREKFDAFLASYFESHAFQTMTTAKFVDYLEKNLIAGDQDLEKRLKIRDWIYGAGLPDNAPVPTSDEFKLVENQIERWKPGTPAGQLDSNDWTTHHWLHFLRSLPQSLTPEQMADLDKAFAFTKTGNAEIACQWLTMSVQNQYHGADQRLGDFLTHIGRRKFLMPLYIALSKTPQGKEKALEIYRQARSGYHPVSYLSIDKLLGVGSSD